MVNYKILLEYDGTRYNGWQKQKQTKNTIQGKLEELLTRLFDYSIEVQGSGRTDAGVHALGQVANFHLKEEINPDELKKEMNHYLPMDIVVKKLKKVDERFHSRLNAKSKTYTYHILLNEEKKVFEKNYYYHLNESLDLEKMKIAAKDLLGTHDFKSFCNNKQMKKSTVRTIEDIQIVYKDNELVLTFKGNGFLYHMVRILTGTLIEIGLGIKKETSIPKILEAKNRQQAGYTVPPNGLFLVRVEY